MKRRWFQIHLSTAVLLLVCVAGAAWTNVEGWSGSSLQTESFKIGWPTAYYVDYKDPGPITSTCGYVSEYTRLNPPPSPAPYVNRSYTTFSIDKLIANIVIILASLFALAVVWEALLETRLLKRMLRPVNINFQLHLSTVLMLTMMAGLLLGLNISVAELPNTLFECGLPIFYRSTDSQNTGLLALHHSNALMINIALNMAACVIFTISFEKFIRSREATRHEAFK